MGFRHTFKVLERADRWGDPDPRSKTWTSGALSIAVYIGVVVYGVFIALQYGSVPLEQTNDIVWSAWMGPFPLALTCAAENCWVSMSLRGAYDACVQEVPASQLDTCIPLQRGETILLTTCYALLPSEGVRLYHTGADSEGWDALAPEVGLGSASDAPFFGMFSVSDMLMPDAMVMPTKTPLRAGVTLMTYVHTVNNSVPEGNEGDERHEWFSQILDNDSPPEPDNAPCAAQIGTAAVDVHVANLRMAPDFTEIEVAHPPSFLMAIFGEIGGALASCDEIFGVLVLIWLRVAFVYAPLRKAVHGSKVFGDEASGKTAGESTMKDEVLQVDALSAGLEEHVQALVVRANAELVQRLTTAEAAVARLEEAILAKHPSVEKPPLAERLLVEKPPEPAIALKPTPDLDGLIRRVRALEEQEAATRQYVELFRSVAGSTHKQLTSPSLGSAQPVERIGGPQPGPAGNDVQHPIRSHAEDAPVPRSFPPSMPAADATELPRSA